MKFLYPRDSVVQLMTVNKEQPIFEGNCTMCFMYYLDNARGIRICCYSHLLKGMFVAQHTAQPSSTASTNQSTPPSQGKRVCKQAPTDH